MLNCYFGKKVEPTAIQNALGNTHLFQEKTLPAVHLNQQINSHSQPRSHVSVVVFHCYLNYQALPKVLPDIVYQYFVLYKVTHGKLSLCWCHFLLI